MPTTNYYSVNGNLLGEATNGIETSYIPDALGSTTQTITSAGFQNQYVYSPYGRPVSKTGTAPDPRFMWNGRTQSRTTGCAYAEQFNQLRHYSSSAKQWTSSDPLWLRNPDIDPYSYADCRPISATDPFGLSPCFAPADCCATMMRDAESSCVSPNTFSTTPPITHHGNCTSASCHSIRERLRTTTIPNCLGMCKKVGVAGTGSYPKGPVDWAAETLCCDNRFCGVVWCVHPGYGDNDPCVTNCLLKHEQEHTL